MEVLSVKNLYGLQTGPRTHTGSPVSASRQQAKLQSDTHTALPKTWTNAVGNNRERDVIDTWGRTISIWHEVRKQYSFINSQNIAKVLMEATSVGPVSESSTVFSPAAI